MAINPPIINQNKKLTELVEKESKNFQECYLWLEEAMPPHFFEEVSQEYIMLITHSLMGFHTQDYFSLINLKNAAIVLCLDSPEADLSILKKFATVGIEYYRTYISTCPPSFFHAKENLRIAILSFTGALKNDSLPSPKEKIKELKQRVLENNPKISELDFNNLLKSLGGRFIRSLPIEKLEIAINLYFRAQNRDHCQYEVLYNDEQFSEHAPSMQIILSWRNTPKHHFLYLLARTVHRHGLVMRGVNAAYITQNKTRNSLILTLGLHGIKGQEAWEIADIPSFLRELITVKYFARSDLIEDKLVKPGFISGSKGNLVRAMVNFIHQALVLIDPNIYSIEHIEWDLCRLPDITKKICKAFKYKFNPDHFDRVKFEEICKEIHSDIDKLDTGHEDNDVRRKHVLRQAIHFVTYTLKTNYYLFNYSALSFRLDPTYLDEIPFERKELFPMLPFAVFYIKGMNYFGFHIRFKDLARGGLRTVFPEYSERMQYECDHVFQECYNLAYTQQKKNKDIPEGGSKGVIFLEPHERIKRELEILRNELESTEMEKQELRNSLEEFHQGQKMETMYQAQRSFIINLMSLINYLPDGRLKTHQIVDYWKKPENIYLGPDENMHTSTLDWITQYSKGKGYRVGTSFITSKPRIGINHKEYGVTSSGVNVYMEEVLRYLGINPETDPFTIKMSGGPGGDVAGNQLLNLAKLYPKTAKILALTDGTGTIYDPEGLDLSLLAELFYEEKGIHRYPPESLHTGGYLLNKLKKRDKTAFIQQTLCYEMKGDVLVENWLSGSEMNQLYRHTVHSTITDIFIPAGGRPRTLNGTNYTDFLDVEGKPTSKAIVEGANLYLDDTARSELEKRGCLIIKDSSANKAGVICSSYEALAGLAISEELFVDYKEELVSEILSIVKKLALKEANLLLDTHAKTKKPLTVISEQISQRINQYTYAILKHLEHREMKRDPTHPLMKIYLDYCPPTLRSCYTDHLIENVPMQHIKAIIACRIASETVYKKGLDWKPTIIDTLPILG